MKLIRDKIHESTFFDGRIRIAEPDEMPLLLRMKLLEEVGEFLASNDPKELADILDVIEAIALHDGIDYDDLNYHRNQKWGTNGGFEKRIVLL